MKKLLSICSFIVICLFALEIVALVKEIIIDDYKEGLNSGRKEKSIRGKTNYCMTSNENIKGIQATSDHSDSALFYKIDYDPNEYPLDTRKGYA